ncbi:MAG: adenylosuccinate lyase family protein [Deltaproteobacteria bacterium]|jgi:adenylosuccinate lyase|nr:adenylosuccinate lyase family protein [Deltaproteobacteria bacterium]
MHGCEPKSHIVESQFYSGGYTTSEARKIFCDRYRYQRWLDVEAALALAQADLGIIPEWAAKNINEKAHLRYINLDAVKEGLKVSSHSLLPLLGALQQACDDGAGQFIHFGATTQDIQDTAQSLEIRDVLTIVTRDLSSITQQVMELAERCMDMVTIGRTHCQHALPMTMGLKMAVWLDEMWRNFERLEALRERVLVSQLFGGVGTTDAFADKGFVLLTKFSERLGLAPPLTAWHASRDRIAEFLATMAIIAGTLAKIADEIRCLARNETGELEEPFQMGKIGSSTMPHKRNPEMCEQVVVLAKLIKANAGLGFEGILNEHERDYRTVRLEWVTVTDTSHFICGLLSLMKEIMKGLIIHEHRIRQNVDRAATLISTEALMFFLGETIGKQTAHQIIYETAMKAKETNQPLLDLLMVRKEIAGKFKREDLEKTIDPINHVGISQELTRRTIDHVKEKLSTTGTIAERERICPLSEKDGRCNVQ